MTCEPIILSRNRSSKFFYEKTIERKLFETHVNEHSKNLLIFLVFLTTPRKLQAMKVKETIEALFKTTIEELGYPTESFTLERPKSLEHGDYASPFALSIAKQEGKNPREIAERIVENIQRNELPPFIQSLSVEGPGFINITLTPSFFLSAVEEIQQKQEHYGKHDTLDGKHILIEHSSPNLFKPFHIGHMMNNTVGESIVRLVKNGNAKTTILSYPSDVSLGIGKAVWKLLDYGIETLGNYETLEEKVAFLGTCYAEGTKAMKEHPSLEKEIREITQDIYEHRDTEAYRAYLKGKELNLQYFVKMTSLLGSHFDDYIFESEAGKVGAEIVRAWVGNVFKESDGAIIFEPNEKDIEQDPQLHARVFINSDGNPTYEAKDLGLLKLKFERYDPNTSIFVTDNEQGPYFRVVSYVAGKIQQEWRERTVHLTHGRMTFKGEKMSSRLGNTPLVSEMLDVVRELVYERAKDKDTLSESDATTIAIAALKYVILRTQIGKSVNFDPDTSLSFEGDSGPYLLYTYARARSVLRKAEKQRISYKVSELPSTWKTTQLEKILTRYQEHTISALESYSPHIIVNYATELAQTFNSWYGNTRILTEEEATPYRLALVETTSIVIKNALHLLGIETLEKM